MDPRSWRIPFLISAALLLFGLWIRLRLEETPVFEHEKAKGETTELPFAEAFRKQWRRSCSAARAAVASRQTWAPPT